VGNSFGVLIPKQIVVVEKIRKEQTVKVAILKKDSRLLERAFGSVKTRPFRREHYSRVL
jgi:hypothetical protein